MTCVSASDCWAVGTYNITNGFVQQTLIEHWDGTSWAVVSSPNVDIPEANLLQSVTCVSAADCWAVGQHGSQTLIEHWDGTSWAIFPSPNSTADADILAGVTCATPSDCWAVGYSLIGTIAQTLTEHWDGTSWAIVPSPNTSDTQSNLVVKVSCVSESDCWAVGYSLIGTTAQTLTEHWDGTSWVIVTSPNTSISQPNYLVGVACVSAADCWAVGEYQVAIGSQTLIERYIAIVPPTLTSVVSRKTHGSDAFDIDLPLSGNPGIECRTAQPSGSHHVVFSFATAVTASDAAVTPSGSGKTAEKDGPPVRSSDGKKITVSLKNVSDAQTITVMLLNVNDSTNNANISVPMGVLAGDTTADRRVNVADTSQTKINSGSLTSANNFRTDVNLDGRINIGDTNFVKSYSGSALP